MKLLVAVVFTVLAVSALADVEKNWEIDWSTVVPMQETPGFWDNRNFKPSVFPRNGRIVGGEISERGAHPYQVGLLARITVTITGLCGGSIIAPRVILTAAHCLERTINTQVILGGHNINTVNEVGQQRQIVQQSGYRMHSQYNPQILSNDIATLILPNEVIFDQFIQPSVLPSGDELNNLFVGDLATVSGWGRYSDTSSGTSIYLRFVNGNIISNEACQLVFSNMVLSSNICTSTTGGRGACNGDSGGPLTIQNNGSSVQIGIVSFGGRGCQRGLPVAFVRVTSFVDWIAENSS